MARLVIFDDRMRGLDLPENAVVIGRSRKVDVPISDGILSRKHCSILPVDGGFRLLDLKSRHGTFVNGERVEKTALEYDDVIEIGNTVLVLLDTDTWDRGEGLTGLRNPVKAQELIQRINRCEPIEPTTVPRDPLAVSHGPFPGPHGPFPGPHGPSPGAGRSIHDAVAGSVSSGGSSINGGVSDCRDRVEVEVLTNLVLHEYAKHMLQCSPALRQLIARSVQQLLAASGSNGDLHDEARRLVLEALAADRDDISDS